MYQALYRKYRPQVFSDVVGQEATVKALKNSVTQGRISHAYLFCGTRGTGKTTCAKILAAAVNCLHPNNGDPCMECENCKAILGGATDIIEMDAASNRGVNDVRELKEQIAFLPSVLKYRVYIIDEVHMLTGEAFNALLKTLEEPPAHVIFILATTESHKLPATILSRCQRYDFKRIDTEIIKARLLSVAEKENIKLEDSAAALIAGLADGGMRDALSLLDQCYGCTEHITEEDVVSICGIASQNILNEYSAAVANKDAKTALEIIDKVYSGSTDIKHFTEELIGHFRNIMVIKATKDAKKLMVLSTEQYEATVKIAESYTLSFAERAINLLTEARENMAHSARKAELELATIRLITEKGNDITSLIDRIEALESGKTVYTPAAAEVKPAPQSKPQEIKNTVPTVADDEVPPPPPEDENDFVPFVPNTEEPQKAETNGANNANGANGGDGKISKWPEILEAIKAKSKLLYGGMSDSTGYLIDGRVLIDSNMSAFREMVNGDSNMREIIKECIASVLGKAYNIGPYKKAEEPPKTEADPLEAFQKSLL